MRSEAYLARGTSCKFKSPEIEAHKLRLIAGGKEMVQMFWTSRTNNKNTGPVSISGPLARLIGEEWGKLSRVDDHWAEYRAVLRPRSEAGDDFDVRIFDKWCASKKKVTVLDYSSLDHHSDLVLLEGWFNKKSKKSEIKAPHPDPVPRVVE
jgi:hypothetical protein